MQQPTPLHKVQAISDCVAGTPTLPVRCTSTLLLIQVQGDLYITNHAPPSARPAGSGRVSRLSALFRISLRRSGGRKRSFGPGADVTIAEDGGGVDPYPELAEGEENPDSMGLVLTSRLDSGRRSGAGGEAGVGAKPEFGAGLARRLLRRPPSRDRRALQDARSANRDKASEGVEDHRRVTGAKREKAGGPARADGVAMSALAAVDLLLDEAANASGEPLLSLLQAAAFTCRSGAGAGAAPQVAAALQATAALAGGASAASLCQPAARLALLCSLKRLCAAARSTGTGRKTK